MNSNDELVDCLVHSGVLEDKAVEEAMRRVDRKDFVPQELSNSAYCDNPLSIGCEQTISAPHMVVIMTQHLQVAKGNKVLEVGAGSGYQAAILSVLVGGKGRIFAVERIPELAGLAEKSLSGYANITTVCGNGALGCAGEAPFDRIIVSCSAKKVPKPLKEQLAEGGRMVVPVGSWFSSKLLLVEGDLSESDLNCDCSFVPLVD